MEKIEKHLKYIPVYGGITYLFGYLILSTRLSSLNIYIKDFLSLDYLKTGILFLLFIAPLALICFQLMKTKNRILRVFLAIFFQGGIILVISPIFFESGMSFKFPEILGTFLLFPILVYSAFIIAVKAKKSIAKFDPSDSIVFVILIIMLTSLFANLIFPQIQFRFGGGAPYSKTIYFKENNNNIKLDVRVYYENDKWIHFLTKDDKIISLPKKNIEREESIINNSLLKLDINR